MDIGKEKKKADSAELEQFLNELYANGYFQEAKTESSKVNGIEKHNSTELPEVNEKNKPSQSPVEVVGPATKSRRVKLDYNLIFAKIPQKVDLYGKVGKVDALREILSNVIAKDLFVKILYASSSEGKLDRTIKPLKIYNEGQNWYCKGYCYFVQTNKVFNLKKIHYLTVVYEEPVKLKKELIVNQKPKHDFKVATDPIKKNYTKKGKPKRKFKINDFLKMIWFLFLALWVLATIRQALL